MAVTNYDAKDCIITVDNTNITGLGEDMVSGEKEEDITEPSVGAQGDVVVNKINNDIGVVTIVVQPTCPQKAFLLGLKNRKEPFPLWVTNTALAEKFGGTKAMLKSYPEMSRGASAEDMEFEFYVLDYDVKATA